MTFLQTTLKTVGYSKIARSCGVTPQAVKYWWFFNKLPDTDYLPKGHPRRTDYASQIALLAKCKRSQLLEQA